MGDSGKGRQFTPGTPPDPQDEPSMPRGPRRHLAGPEGRPHHFGMRLRPLPLLLVPFVAWLALAGADVAGEDITIFRCVGDKGAISLQDKPCAKGTEQTSREMVRPKDAPPRKLPEVARVDDLPPPPEAWEYLPPRSPPPPMYVCTSYDGIVRESEVYDPNPRCEPLVLYYPEPERLSRRFQQSCRWVEDSCVRLSDEQSCERWRANRKKAASEALHADSSMQGYRDSELRRIEQILEDHCD
jgi:hypothetical protein